MGETLHMFTGTNVILAEIENIIDKTILGGFILRFENTEYNASFSQKLNKLKSELIQ